MAASSSSTELKDKALADKLQRLFRSCMEYESWGQVHEAMEGYIRLSNFVEKEVERVRAKRGTMEVIQKLYVCFKVRGRTLSSDSSSGVQLTKEDMRRLVPVVDNLFSFDSSRFPVDTSPWVSTVREFNKSRFSLKPASSGGCLLPAPSPQVGCQFLCIQIDKFGLKDAVRYVEPFLTVSLCDEMGDPLEPPQDTPVAVRLVPLYVKFGVDIFLQTKISDIPDSAAIFFEFKHFKKGKNKVSTRCFAFMEMDELKEGEIALEIYKKPTRFKRTKLQLFSVKPLYLHLNMNLQTY